MGTGKLYTRSGGTSGLGELTLLERIELGECGGWFLRSGCIVMRLQ